ncbi:MAG: four helix bundle protein [Candidatus Berkelbacteria bacterium]
MQEFDIPIFKKAYELYKQFHTLGTKVPKQDRYSIFLKSENYLLKVIEGILKASQLGKDEKLPSLIDASSNLSLLKVFVRLMKDVKTIELKTYTSIEMDLDEIGRMLGGWIKSTKE